MSPEVSIIIINYNTPDFTVSCVESIRKQTLQCAYEIILVDNGSQPDNIARFRHELNGVTLVESKENLGFAGGNNLGLKYVNSAYVLLLNSDTELKNDAISLALEKIKNDSTIGAITVKTIFPDGSPQYVSNNFKTLGRQLTRLFRLHKLLRPVRAPHQLIKEDKEHNTEWIWGSFFMFPLSILDSFEGKKLHDDFFMYGEDKLWCHHIGKLGFKIKYYPAGVIVHHLSRSAAAGQDEISKYHTKILPNEYRMFVMLHGKLYAIMFYITTALLYFTWGSRSGLEKASFYFRFAIRNLFTVSTH